MSRQPPEKPNEDGFWPVRIGGRLFPVIGRIKIRGRTYLLLEQLSVGQRRRFKAFNPHAGPEGELRAVHVYERTPAAMQHIESLARLPKMNWAMPHILDYEDNGDELRLALNWIEGLDLKTYLDRVRQGGVARISPYEAVRLVNRLAQELWSLHSYAQIIHGDVKPDNLILTRKRSFLVPIDFGSAWFVERTAFRDEGDGVSPFYAAPELQNGEAGVNFRTDQFSASVILYELLTLKRPYLNLGGKAGRSEFRDSKSLMLEPPSRCLSDPGSLPKRIADELDRVVARGLELKADDRFPTTRIWLDALDGLFQMMKVPADSKSQKPDRVGRVVDWLVRKVGVWS